MVPDPYTQGEMALAHRQQLQRVDPERREIGHLQGDIEEFAFIGGCSNAERAYMQLIENEIIELRRAPAGVVPRECGGVAHETAAIGKWRLKR